jgi:hypothetical protein
MFCKTQPLSKGLRGWICWVSFFRFWGCFIKLFWLLHKCFDNDSYHWINDMILWSWNIDIFIQNF